MCVCMCKNYSKKNLCGKKSYKSKQKLIVHTHDTTQRDNFFGGVREIWEMASGDVINSIEEYDLKDLGAKKKTSTIDRSSYGKFFAILRLSNFFLVIFFRETSRNASHFCYKFPNLSLLFPFPSCIRCQSRRQNVNHGGKWVNHHFFVPFFHNFLTFQSDTNPRASTYGRSKTDPERKIGHRRVGEGGEITYKKIQTTQIMGAIQLGIQHTVRTERKFVRFFLTKKLLCGFLL